MSNKETVYALVADILNAHELDPLMRSVTTFIAYLENADKKHGAWACKHFWDTFSFRDYSYRQKPFDSPYNAVIISPGFALSSMLSGYVPYSTNPAKVTEGFRRFLRRCEEFVPPVHPAITEDEIHAVLRVAQAKFGMINIIAPDTPLRIHRLEYSHAKYNSECAPTNRETRQSLIFLYHPWQKGIYDRVLIFAHELGHALHFALTGDIETLPQGFNELNNVLGAKFETLQENQEGFADATAFAILGNGLKEHLPLGYTGVMTPHFIRYFKELINRTA